MSQLILDKKDPIELFYNASNTKDIRLKDRFILMIKHLYQFAIFQPILDLAATKILEGHLAFEIHDQRFFDLDEGNCKTIYGNTINQLWNKVRAHNNYLITIKKLSYDVIIHEVSHMIEKELDFNLSEFVAVLKNNLAMPNNSIAIKKTIEQIMILEVNNYKENQRSSELFARYFQILCMSKEVSGLSIQTGYSLDQIIQHFESITQWVNTKLNTPFRSIIHPFISNYSCEFIQNLKDVNHKWSEQKVNPIHRASGEKKWSKAVSSIKHDPFNDQ